MVYYAVRTNDYLAHHGINGQKWGHRNGPPYPLSADDHSAAEKKLNKASELDNYGTKAHHKSNKSSDTVSKSSSGKKGMTDEQKEKAKKIATVAAATAATALAAYGAYKFVDATKSKAYEKYNEAGKSYVKDRTNLELKDLDKEIKKAQDILNDKYASAYYKSTQNERIRAVEAKKKRSSDEMYTIESKYKQKAEESSKNFKNAFNEVYGKNRKVDSVKKENNIRDNYGKFKVYDTPEQRAKKIAKNMAVNSKVVRAKTYYKSAKRNVQKVTKFVKTTAPKVYNNVKYNARAASTIAKLAVKR